MKQAQKNSSTSALVFFERTRSQLPIIVRIDAKYASPNKIQNHTKGLYQWSLPSFPESPLTQRHIIQKQEVKRGQRIHTSAHEAIHFHGVNKLLR